MFFNTFFILLLSELVLYVCSKNYTGHAVYKIHAKNLIRSHTEKYLDEDEAIILANGSIPLPKGLQKLWQGIETNGDEFAVVYSTHPEPKKRLRSKRDLNYHLLTDDLNSWITGSYRSSNANPIIVPLDNYGILGNVQSQQLHQQQQQQMQTFDKENYLKTSESNTFQSFLTPSYESFWSILQSPFKTLASQLTNWNLIPMLSSSNYQMPSSSLNAMSSGFNRNPDGMHLISNSFQNTFTNSLSGINSIQHQIANPHPPKPVEDYKSSASSNAVRHESTTSAQEQAPVYLSAFIPAFRLDVYHNLNEIYDYLERLASKHNQIRIYTIGFSHENRPIKAIEIHQDLPNLNRKIVYLDGLIHAREHITSASLLNIIEQILIRKIQCNFLIVPVINVDGYVYTWTTDRLWRKNRRKINSNSSLLNSLRSRFVSERCNGVDLNRNWRVNFGGVGSSLNPCSELYAGASALSEPETSALARLLWDNRHRIRLFISLHSFGQLWAAPHSYTRAKAPHHDLHMSVLKEVQQAVYNVQVNIFSSFYRRLNSIYRSAATEHITRDASASPEPVLQVCLGHCLAFAHIEHHFNIFSKCSTCIVQVNNVLYNVGPLGSSLYLGSGYSLDYAYEELNIVHSYLVEVRDQGDFGFLLPPEQILPTSFEILEGILVSIKRTY